MSFADANPGYRLETEDQCKNWVLELVGEAIRHRDLCDVVIPGDMKATVRDQKLNYRSFMVKHGSALGALMALHRTGDVSDVLYEEMRQKITGTLVPTVITSIKPSLV